MRQGRSGGGVGGPALGAVLIAILFLCTGRGEAGTVSYRQGDGKGSVSQTDDTRLEEPSPTANFSAETTCGVDQTAHQHCVLKFPNIFGDSANQVPPSSQILSATLTVYVSDSSVDCPIVYQLTEAWTEAEATWDERMTGIAWASPGAEGAVSHKAVPEGILPCFSAGTNESVDVTDSVQRWSDGEPNEGWVFVNPANNNGTAFATSESPTLARRPELTVSFVPTVFYSVGVDPGDLKTGSPTITISGTTATLSVAQLGDVGVGDMIDYDTPNQLVYISSVVSSTQFTVQKADGSLPPPTVGTPDVNGIRRAFNSIDAAVAGSSDAVHLNTSDLAGTFRKLHWVLYDDGPFDLFSTASITGYTTGPDYNITVTAAGASQVASGNSQRHTGTAGTGVRLEMQATGQYVLDVDVPYTRIEWVEIDGNDNPTVGGILVKATADETFVANSVIHNTRGDSVSGSALHVTLGADGVQAHNLLAYDFGGDGAFVSGSNGKIANSTFHLGASPGSSSIRTDVGGDAEGRNVLAVGPNTAFREDTAGSLHLYNSISTDTSACDLDFSGSCRTSVSPVGEFVSPGGPVDLHLRPGAVAIDFGADLSASFADDIDGQTRPLMAAWDVGADEAPAFSARTHYRSIGTALNLVNQGTIAVTAGSATVTKTGGLGWLAENRGRGDVLVVGPGPDTYTVLDVSSDDELTLTSPATASFTGTTYTIARQFTTLQGWEDCISNGGPSCAYFPVPDGDLVGGDRSEVGIAYADSAFALTSAVLFDGATTDASHTITLTADARNRHHGSPGGGVVVDGQGGPNGIVVRDDHVTIEWLEIVRVRGANDLAAILVEGSGQTSLLFQNLLIHDFYNDGGVAGIGLSNTGFGNRRVTIRNAMIWDGDEEGIQGGRATDQVLVENCSIDDMRFSGAAGIDAADGVVTVVNTIVTRSGGGIDFNPDLGSFSPASTNNISSDGSAPGTNALTAGAAAIFAFLDPGPTHNHDLHLKPGGNPAVDSGVDLFPTSGFHNDVDGQLRPIGPGWDRGADEAGAGVTDLALSKDDGQATVVPGTPISYVITLTNNGPDPIASVMLTDTVPAGVLGVSFNTANGSYNGSSGVWTFAAPLSAGQDAVLTMGGTIDPGATGTLTNTAVVAPPLGYADPIPGNNTATDVDTLAPEADLALAKTENADPIDIGNLLVYTLTVTNGGPSDATGVVVVDTLVPDVEYQSATPTQGLCNYDGPSRTLTCNLGVVAPGSSATVTLAVRPLILTTVANTASVGGNEPDPVPGNNAASEMTTVVGAKSCIVTTDLAGGDDWGSGVAVQADGRIVLGGYGYRPAPGGLDFAVLGYTPDLQLDGSFGAGGKTATEIDLEDWANAVSLQSDGRILLSGHNRVGEPTGNDDFALVRYNPDGSLDTSLNPSGTYGYLPNLPGIVTTQVDTLWDLGRASALQNDGKILLAGAVQVGGAAGSFDLGIVRYLPDGDLDPSFGTGGRVTTPIGADKDYATAIAVQPDGKIVLAGATFNGSDWDWVIARYDPDGSLDGSFGAGGIVVADHGIDDWTEGVAVQPDGKIVVMGQSNVGSDADLAVARYNPDGSVDVTFNPAGTFGDPPNQPGTVFVRMGPGNDLIGAGALQPDGRILAVGWSHNGLNDDFAMVRLNPDGSLDPGFGSGGKVTTAIGGGRDEAHAVALQPDGRMLLAGRSYNVATSNWDFALARYTPTGRLEGGCGTTRYRSIGTAPDLVDQGTITVTAGSSKVTKSGGVLGWLAENRGQGDVLVVGPDTYSILDVVSDDELTLASVPATGYVGGNYTIARQFTTLKDWEDCISGSTPCPYFPVGSGNLITDDRSEVGVAYKDSVFALTAMFRMDGSTTDALHTITLTANRRNRHNGLPGTGVVVDAQSGPFGIDVEDDYVTLEWLEIIRFRGIDNEGAITLSGGDGPRGVLLQSLLIHDFFDPTYDVSGIRLSGVGVKDVTVRNTMIWDGDEQGIWGDEPFDVLTIENTSIDGIVDAGGRGIYAEDSAVTVVNTIVTRSASADFDPGTSAFTGSNNTSSDTTAPGPGFQHGVAAAAVFVSPGVDLHLKGSPNPALDTGRDLFSASGFRHDVEGQLRPADAAWDRGADEFSSSTLDLGVTKDDAQGAAVPGTGISYVITVTNSGPDPVTSVTLSDPVPPAILGAYFTTLNGSYNGGTGQWTFAAPLLAGQSAVLTLTGTIDPGATGVLANTATVAPPPGFTDPVPGNDSATDVDTLMPSADVALTKTGNVALIAIGNLLTYTLTATNNGPSNASGVMVIDTLVPEMQFESATPSQGLCNYDVPTRTLTCDLGTIVAGGGATVTLGVRALALGTFGNTASVTATEPDPVGGNNTATESTMVVTASEGVLFFTVTSTFEQNVLEWLNPALDYVSTEIVYRTDRFPTGPGDPGSTTIYNGGTAGLKDRIVHGTGGGSNGITHYYGAFVHRSAAPALSTGRFCSGRPFDSSGVVKWAFSTGAFSITPPTVGGAGVVAPANDRALYAMERGPLGGEWPAGWHPAQLGGVVQSRSPVVPIVVSGANPVVYLGAQDGSVYVVDGTLGGAAAFPWLPSPIAGMVQAAPAGIFSAFGAGPLNYLLVGTRDDGVDNALVALDPTSGAVIASFNNGGSPTGIGVISGMATVDYAARRVYFASHEHPAGSSSTLWCVQLGPPGPVFTLLWQRSLGDIDGSPVVRGGRVYVGSTLGGGTVYSIDAATGNPVLDRTFVHGDGAVKEFVWPDRSSVDLYFATNNFVWAVSDTGAASIPNKFAGAIPLGGGVTPSPVLFVPGSHYVYVGGSDGRLYEIDVLGAAPTLKSEPLGDGTATVGAPSFDWFYGLVHVGTEAGIFYAVEGPLP